MNNESTTQSSSASSMWMQSIPILATKLYAPPTRQEFVFRSRLLDQLTQSLQGKLTLVSAPAGFGKTSLVSDWLGRQELPHAWLSLDEREEDPARFLAYLVAALQTLDASLGVELMAALQAPQHPPLEVISTNLINELATLSQRSILVLDDYHVIDARAVDDQLMFLLEHLPPQLHLVILTREDPQLPLARLRARRLLFELRAEDLRFLPEEAAAFLSQIMGLELKPEQIASLDARTEGWIAGLQLAALSLQGRSDVAGFIEAFAGDNRYIVDYLLEEVLQQQPDDVRSFLLQTSILERLCGSLCDAVTSQSNSHQRLLELERGNLFVVPLDDKREWFRYHHLFGDVLYAHARRERPDEVSEWHSRASAWLEEQGDTAEAISHAISAEDFERAARIIELSWPSMDARMQTDIWMSWAEQLPDTIARSRPVICAGFGWALLSAGDMEACESWLQLAEELIEQHESGSSVSGETVVVDETQYQHLSASLETAWAYRSLTFGALDEAIEHAEQALALLPEDDYLRRGPAASLLSLAYWSNGDLEAAHSSLDEAMNDFFKTGNLTFALSGTYGLADLCLGLGKLRAALRHYEQSLEHVKGKDVTTMRGVTELYLGMADLLHEQGKQQQSQTHFEQCLVLGEDAALPDWNYRRPLVESRFLATEGKWALALEKVEEAEKHFYRSPVPMAQPIPAWKARCLLALGRLADARAWAEEHQLSHDEPLHFLREYDLLILARLLQAESLEEKKKEPEEQALRLLDRLLQAAEAEERNGSVLGILVTKALVLESAGQTAQAQDSLLRALSIAEPEGYVRTFVMEGAPMQRLLSTLKPERSRLQTHIQTLLAAFGEPVAVPQTQAVAPMVPSEPVPPLIEPLSARELEILALIAQGLSNRDISQTLHVALSTVKGHNQNIFGKLGVRRRTEAVARARALRLI